MEFNLPAGKHATTFPRLCPVTSSRSQALRTPPTLSPKPPRFPLSLTHASVSSSAGGAGKRPAVTPKMGLTLCWAMAQTLDGRPPEDAAEPRTLLYSLPISPPGTLPQNPLPLSAVPARPGSDIPHCGIRGFTRHVAGGLGPGRLAEAGQTGG